MICRHKRSHSTCTYNDIGWYFEGARLARGTTRYQLNMLEAAMRQFAGLALDPFQRAVTRAMVRKIGRRP